MAEVDCHPELRKLQERLQQIYDAISNFHPASTRPPILDSSLDAKDEAGEDSHWHRQERIPGLKKLKESLKIDLDGLQKFLEDPQSAFLPPLSTNAPYLISVWKEVLCAPPPITCVFKTFLLDPSKPISSAERKRGAGRPPGAKVDVVADNGRCWIRVNTVKNARLLAEFREIDSYLTESEEDSDWDETRPTLAQSEFDNSLLRMGRALLLAAQANPIEGTTEIPQVVMRLTRVDPTTSENTEADPRIAQTIQCLRDMGIEVQLGKRPDGDLPPIPIPTAPTPPPILHPSLRINLDLSVLIALISDLTHATLPLSLDEAKKRFIPPKEYREWKEARRQNVGQKDKKYDQTTNEPERDLNIEDLPHDLATHSRALTNQLLQEMGKSMIQEIRDRLMAIPTNPSNSDPPSLPPVDFWATPEARDRCLRIVSKIGGPDEKRRAYALFCLDPSSPTEQLPVNKAEELFWQNSRFDRAIPLFPLHFHSSTLPSSSSLLDQRASRAPFFKILAKTCQDILAQETIPHPRSLRQDFISQPTSFPVELSAPSHHVTTNGEIQRATVTKANPRLTAHTVESLLWGAELGWTTLTANRTSVRAILKEIKVATFTAVLDDLSLKGDDGDSESTRDAAQTPIESESDKVAALWIVDPRSLAEGMSSQPSNK